MALAGNQVNTLNDIIVRQVQYAINVSGAQAITDLNNSLVHVNQQIATQDRLYAAGVIDLIAYENATRNLVAQQVSLTGQINLATAAMANGGVITDRMVARLNRAGTAWRGMGQGMIQVAYVMDDMQYGFQAMQNNIVPIITAFGGSGPIATGMAITAASSMLLFNIWKNFPKISEALGIASHQISPWTTEIENLKEKIADLNKIKVKMQVDRTQLAAAEEDLKRLTKAQEDYRHLQGLKTKAEEDSEKAKEDAIKNAKGGPQGVREALLRPLIKSAVTDEKDPAVAALSEENRKVAAKIKEFEAKLAAARVSNDRYEQHRAADYEVEIDSLTAKQSALGDKLKFAREQAVANAERNVGEMTGKAGPGVDVEQHGKKLADALEKVGRGDVAKEIRDTLPSNVERFQRDKKVFADMVDRWQKDEDQLAKDIKKSNQEFEAHRFKGVVDQWQKGNSAFGKHAEQDVGHIVAKFGGASGMQDAVDERIANLVKEGKSDEQIKPVIEAYIAAQLAANGVHPGLVGDAAAKMATGGIERFDAANAGRRDAGGRVQTADEILKDLNKKKAAEDLKLANAEKARLAEAAAEQKGADSMIESGLAGNALRNAQFNATDPMFKREAIQNAKYDFGELARNLGIERKELQRQGTRGGRKLTPDEQEHLALMKDQQELAVARSRNPLVSEEQEQKNQAEFLARRMTRAGTKDKAGKVMSLDENRKVAGAVAQEAQQNLNARLANMGDASMTRVDKLIALNQAMLQKMGQQEARAAQQDARINGMRRGFRDMRGPNIPLGQN